MKLELDCKQVARLISDGLDSALDPAEQARMRMHFLICSKCRNVSDQMEFLRRAIRGMGQAPGQDP
jgi:predicted anti-sigma-YlaC factor YlaD